MVWWCLLLWSVNGIHVLPGVVSTTNPRYASWNIDSSYNRGFFHTNFTNPNLLAAARSLYPSTLRFGGTGNDYLHYGPPPHPCSSDHDSDTYGCLNATHWNELYGMVNASGADFLFGISFDMSKACDEKAAYTWNSTNAARLVSYIRSQHQHIWGFELGNEVNNRGTKCSLNPKQQAEAFHSFTRDVLQRYYPTGSRPFLVGPDSGYLYPKAWLQGFLDDTTVHAVTHHVYPGITSEDYNSPRKFDEARNEIRWYVDLLREHAPNAEIWAGEDGPHGGGEDGTCGTHSVCGTYATVLWYADDLGLRARSGFKQYQRQDIIGGRYALLGSPHDDESLGPKDPVRLQPDYWVTFMWKRVMGDHALNVSLPGTSGGNLRAYAHCGPPPSPYAVASFATSILLINLSNTTTLSVPINGSSSYTWWTLAPGSAGVFGQDTLMNGTPLPTMLSNGKPIDHVPVPGRHANGATPLSLPPTSVTFVSATGISSVCV